MFCNLPSDRQDPCSQSSLTPRKACMCRRARRRSGTRPRPGRKTIPPMPANGQQVLKTKICHSCQSHSGQSQIKKSSCVGLLAEILITWQSSAEETPVCIWTGLPGGREQLRGTNLLQVSYADPAQSSRVGGAPPDTVPQLERKSPLPASLIRLHSLNS